MEMLRALAAILIACGPVWLLLNGVIPRGLRGRQAIIAGYSLLLGLLLVTVVLRLHSVIGLGFNAILVAVSLFPVAALGVWLYRRQGGPTVIVAPGPPLGLWEKLLIAACLLLIILRVSGLYVEVSTQPIFPWDAKMHWAKTAKVFFEHGSVVEYVRPGTWLVVTGDDIYSSFHARYPVTVPLVQTWVALLIGHWHEVYVNLPWWFCYIGLGLIFYGQAVAVGVRPSIALVGTYMVLSLPLLNGHVAMAGYADLFLATAFLGALAAFVVFSEVRNFWPGALLIVSLTACLLLKNEGFFWGLSLIMGSIVLLCGPKRGVLVIIGMALIGLLLIWLLPPNTIVAGHTIRQMLLSYRPDSWYPLFEGFFLHDNWHLVFYLFIVALLASAVWHRQALSALFPALVVITCALSLYFILYLFTGYAATARDHTSVNRVALHFVPSILFVTVILYAQLISNGPSRKNSVPAD